MTLRNGLIKGKLILSFSFIRQQTLNAEGQEEKLKFDRILCDVPCSGDGTMRKNPDIWGKWNTAQGTNLNG